MGLLNVIVTGKIIDTIIKEVSSGKDFKVVMIWLVVFIGILATNILLEQVRGYFEIIYNNYTDLMFDDSYFGKLITLDPQTHLDPDFMAKRAVLNWNGWKVTHSSRIISIMIGELLPVILYVGTIISYNWLIGLLAMVSVLPTMFTSMRFGKRVWAIWDDNSDIKIKWDNYRDAAHRFSADTYYMGYGKYVVDKMTVLYNVFLDKLSNNESRRLRSIIFAGLIEYALVGLAYTILLKNIISGVHSIGAFAVITGALWGAKASLGNLFERYVALESNINFIDAFMDLIRLKPAITSPENAKAISEKEPISIEFKDVWFKYPKTKKWIFKGLNLKITKDEDVAIVGVNGAGKSTLMKLILRMYDPDKGEILINGINLRNIEINSYFKSIGFLTQDFQIYNFPVNENIWIGEINNLEKRDNVDHYAKKARAHEFIAELPHGYENYLTTSLPDGVKLSGGQQQRLAIARVFYRDPRLLILDEPTSAIDALGEEEIFNNIFEFAEDKTVIIISHRFATVKKAKQIFVIDKGEIVEQGKHAELMKIKGLYKKMYDAQTSGLKEENLG